MNRIKNIDIILSQLLEQNGQLAELPSSLTQKQLLMRALMNTRPPGPLTADFIARQDLELQMQREERGSVTIEKEGVVLWKGDITRLKVDAIVNAANSQALGCFIPLHSCIDNCIHSAAGLQLRNECNTLMKGGELATGDCIITKGYNLPAKYVIHTVGPICATSNSNVSPTDEQKRLLAKCYTNCLHLASHHNLQSIAFCCISTGVFNFPNLHAAQIATDTVNEFINTQQQSSLKTIIFNVFSDNDYEIYRTLLT